MKAKFGDFTRGSQLIETFGLMFAAGLKPMAWALFTTLSAALGYLIWHDMSSDDLYRCIMRGYSWFWDFLSLDPKKPVSVVGPNNSPVKMPIGMVDFYPPVRNSWDLLISTIITALTFTAIVGVPVCFGYTWASRQIGNKALRRNHERGATLASIGELIARVNAYNDATGKPERRTEFRRIYGRFWWMYAPFAKRDELLEAGMYQPYQVAGVPFPWRAEQTHMFAVGTTGTGKSTMMRDLLAQIRERGGKAVVFDLTGTYIETFYDETRDIILNPFDTRCPQWSVFNDCETRAEFTSAAEAMIPSDGGGSEPFWIAAARLLFIEACIRLAQRGHRTNKDLHDYLMVAALKQVNELMKGTAAQSLTAPEAARMAESIRATLNTNINAIECLPTTGKQFSIKDWVKTETEGGSVLFIAARHVDLSTVRVLLTLWMDTAINTLMSMPPSPRDVRIWYLFDEVGALHRLPAIEKGMQTARNFGGAFVLGVHTIAKLRETYGDKIAETLGSLARTKLMLATADYSSAQWCSQQIGNGEWRQMEEGYSYGYSNVRDAVTLTNKRQLEPLVLPDDISKLPDLSGWLVFPQGFPAARIKLEITRWPRLAPGFIQRPDISGPTKKIDDEVDPESTDDGPPAKLSKQINRVDAAKDIARIMAGEGFTDTDTRAAYGDAYRNYTAMAEAARAARERTNVTVTYVQPTAPASAAAGQLHMDLRPPLPSPSPAAIAANPLVPSSALSSLILGSSPRPVKDSDDAAQVDVEHRQPGAVEVSGRPMLIAKPVGRQDAGEDLTAIELRQDFVPDRHDPEASADDELGR